MPTTEDVINWEIPKPVRTLTREEIAKEYGEKAVKPMKVFAARKPKPYVVLKVFDDKREEIVSDHDTYELADAEAGRKRDTMTDDECGGDFTYLPGKRTNQAVIEAGKIGQVIAREHGLAKAHK